MSEAMQRAGVLGEREVPVAGVYGLRDEPGCIEQDLHTDWDTDVTAEWEWEHAEDALRMPGSVIWAAEARFVLSTEGPGGSRERIVVPRGCMAVFMGDWRHGGGGHVTREFRVHGYVRPKCQQGKRLRVPQHVYPPVVSAE